MRGLLSACVVFLAMESASNECGYSFPLSGEVSVAWAAQIKGVNSGTWSDK